MRSFAYVAVGIVLFFAAAIAVRYIDADRAAPGGSASPAVSGPTAPTAPTAPTQGTTTVPSDTSVTLVGAGDIASCSSTGDEATAALVDHITGTVFAAGDDAYQSGSVAEFRDCYGPTWGQFRDRTLPVPGNHEYNSTGAAGYFAYFGTAAGNLWQGWYARDVGTWRVIVLNSNCRAIGGCETGSDQETWLRAELAQNPRACTLAIWHHPRFSSGLHGSNTVTADLWKALSDAGAEIVITGHDHDYERFGPQTAAGLSDPQGIVEFVVGTGGRSHYPIGRPVANSIIRNDDTYGVLKLDLSPGSWASVFVPEAGKTFTDTGSGTCH